MAARASFLPSSDPPLIELDEVVKVFRTTAGDFLALKGINLTFERGEFTAIMGKSGSGKSTLINMITGIDHPTSGSVRVEGSAIHRMKEGQLAVWRGRSLGIVFQFFQLLPTLSILENTMLPMDFCDVYDPAKREEVAMGLLELVGLEEAAYKQPAALSGGQQQIAAIARALANDPPIIVADEPTGNLDSRTAERILSIFEELAARGKTILIVTHDPTLARRSTRRVVISDGELINEHVAQALHMLPHPQLLRITHLSTFRTYDPGTVITRQNMLDAGLYVITQGTVEIICEQERGILTVLGQVHPGEYFSELEMIQDFPGTIFLRASAAGPVSALCLSVELFNGWLNQSPEAARLLRHAADEHFASLCHAAITSPRGDN